MKKISLVCGLLLLLSACAMNSASPALRPESLIHSSSEKISFPVSDMASLSTVENWIAGGDAPSSAELTCPNRGKVCNSVKKMLSKRGVTVKEVPIAPGAAGNVALIYNRLIAHECAIVRFGCSTSVNALHMVANREQFTKPALSDFQDAASAVKTVGKYVQ